ncbi:hypothetical protein [Novosphingobium sp.]|uniref:hypothetical protein n=1 Tax=Novosphingobium sp. TaxID=1874826 RepID=UPI0027332BD6|nr:hypothetical protein [Novosphingobium sp.]MDP3908655.1 hypothetical protein [Novosphingobium sp.]
MRKPEWIAIIACIVLSLTVFVGSTGLGYAVYRPLRYYDIFSLVIAWTGLAYHLWRGHRAG